LNHCSQTLSINKHSKICYRHFHSDDYIANHTGLTRYLKATAIPSIFTETNSNSTILNNHPSVDMNTNRSFKFNSLSEPSSSSSSLLVLPLKSSPTGSVPTLTNTKAKRLLNTIDKLHQIQNANKVVMTQNMIEETKQIKVDEDNTKIIEQQITKTNQIMNENSFQSSQTISIDHQNQESKRKSVIY
jgi:hypothetical protein